MSDPPPAFTLDELRDLLLRAEFYAASAQMADGDPAWYIGYAGLKTMLEVLVSLYEQAAEREGRLLRMMGGKKEE